MCVCVYTCMHVCVCGWLKSMFCIYYVNEIFFITFLDMAIRKWWDLLGMLRDVSKFWGCACSSQIVSLIKNKTWIKIKIRIKIKIYYSDWIMYKGTYNVEESTVSVINVVVALFSIVVNSFFYGSRRKSNMTLLGSVAPLRVWWSEETVLWCGFF